MSPPKFLVPVTAVFRPLTTCMPHTRGEGGGKNCVSLSRTRFFVIADFCFPSRSCPYPVSVSLIRPAECAVRGVNSPGVPHPSIPTPSFRSFRVPSCSFPSLPQFAVASPVKAASKIHSRTSLVAPQYTHHTHVHAVHLSCRHIFWGRHIRMAALGPGS